MESTTFNFIYLFISLFYWLLCGFDITTMMTLYAKPWFSRLSLNKFSSSSICRMRIGHCCHNVQLTKIHVKNSKALINQYYHLATWVRHSRWNLWYKLAWECFIQSTNMFTLRLRSIILNYQWGTFVPPWNRNIKLKPANSQYFAVFQRTAFPLNALLKNSVIFTKHAQSNFVSRK